MKKIKTKDVKLGTFYGFDFSMKVPADLDLPDKFWQDKYSDWRIDERRMAVREYQSEQLLQKMKQKRCFFNWFCK